MTTNTMIKRKEGLDCTSLNDDMVMMDLEQGKYYSFNAVGTQIWEKIENPIAVGTLVQQLMSEYQVDQEACQQQVLEFVEMLHSAQLVHIN